MAKTVWPTTTELTNRLTGLGATLPAGMLLQDELDTAVDVLEALSDQFPFLVEVSAGNYSFNPAYSDWLDLRGSWVEIVSVTVAGDALTLNEDYWLEPYGGPYTGIRFSAQWGGEPQTVVVNGKRGYSATIPNDVWKAVLDYAAGSIYQTASMAGSVNSGPVSEIQQDSVKVKFGGGGSASSDTASLLMDGAKDVFMRYRRLSAGNYI